MRTIRYTVLAFALLTVAFFGWHEWYEYPLAPPARPTVRFGISLYLICAGAAGVWCFYPRRWLAVSVGTALICLSVFAFGVDGRTELATLLHQPSQLWRLVPVCGLTLFTAYAACLTRRPVT